MPKAADYWNPVEEHLQKAGAPASRRQKEM